MKLRANSVNEDANSKAGRTNSIEVFDVEKGQLIKVIGEKAKEKDMDLNTSVNSNTMSADKISNYNSE